MWATQSRACFRTVTVIAGFWAWIGTNPLARGEASLFYFEVGGGLSQIRAANHFFNGAAPPTLSSTLGFGLAADLTLAINLGERNAHAGYHIGIQGRYGSGSDSVRNLSLSLLNVYPFLRIEMDRLFLTLGISPFAWQRAQAGAGFDSFTQTDGMLFALTEVGYHHPITPSISFGIVGAAQFASVGGNFSYDPHFTATGFLRFNYGRARAASGVNSDKLDNDGPYPGWRYPYGLSK